MSRSGYTESYNVDNWSWIMWRGRVASATRGKRGQKFFRDLLAALEAMPEKRLIKNQLQQSGEVCAIGSLGVARSIDMSSIDPEDYDKVASCFDIASVLAREVAYMNDEYYFDEEETSEHRYHRMVDWVKGRIKS